MPHSIFSKKWSAISVGGIVPELQSPNPVPVLSRCFVTSISSSRVSRPVPSSRLLGTPDHEPKQWCNAGCRSCWLISFEYIYIFLIVHLFPDILHSKLIFPISLINLKVPKGCLQVNRCSRSPYTLLALKKRNILSCVLRGTWHSGFVVLTSGTGWMISPNNEKLLFSESRIWHQRATNMADKMNEKKAWQLGHEM